MTNHSGRSRITAWPLDAWAKRLVSNHEDEAPDMPLAWCDPRLWDRVPAGYDHVAYVEIGSGAERDYDRGALLRSQENSSLAMWTGRVLRNINQRKAEAALATLMQKE